MSKLFLFLFLVVGASASTVLLENQTDNPQTMIARGASSVVSVDVAAHSSVVVEVGEGVFDIQYFAYAFGGGFTTLLPFLCWGIIRRMFQEATP